MSLQIQGLNIKDVCEEYETPFYIYSSEKIRSQYRKLDEAFNSQTGNYSINYAVKAIPNPSVVSLLTDEGTGLDCASRAEMELALRKVDS